MIHGGYDAFDDPYCYKGTFILKNKAGLRHIDTLQNFELEMSSLRAAEPFPDGLFDPSHYKAVHHHTSIAGLASIAKYGPRKAAMFSATPST